LKELPEFCVLRVPQPFLEKVVSYLVLWVIDWW
jgi:hypothetical protein